MSTVLDGVLPMYIIYTLKYHISIISALLQQIHSTFVSPQMIILDGEGRRQFIAVVTKQQSKGRRDGWNMKINFLVREVQHNKKC